MKSFLFVFLLLALPQRGFAESVDCSGKGIAIVGDVFRAACYRDSDKVRGHSVEPSYMVELYGAGAILGYGQTDFSLNCIGNPGGNYFGLKLSVAPGIGGTVGLYIGEGLCEIHGLSYGVKLGASVGHLEVKKLRSLKLGPQYYSSTGALQDPDTIILAHETHLGRGHKILKSADEKERLTKKMAENFCQFFRSKEYLVEMRNLTLEDLEDYKFCVGNALKRFKQRR